MSVIVRGARECASIEHLSAAAEAMFQQHPDYEIITSFPGIAAQAGARLLAEIGDDRSALPMRDR